MSTVNPPALPRDGATPAGTQPSESQRAAAAAMLPMIWGIHISRAVYVAAELRLADLLADGPATCTELARATGTHEPSLYRVLRLLAALGVFQETGPRCFGLTALGERLRTDAPAGMRSWAIFLEAIGGVSPFEHILHSVRTGEPGFGQAQGMGIFEFLAKNPHNAAIFDTAMSERTAAFAPSVAGGYDFADIRTVVDVGGGTGTLLAEILRRHAHLRGILFETPAVAARARSVTDATDIAGRCEALAGDFFAGVPGGAECYLLANVLHDWDDTRAGHILRNCRRAMARGGRVLIVERLIPDHPGDAVPTLLSDINMLVITGGRERTNAEYSDLLAAAGLAVGKVQPMAFPYGLIEGFAA
jgi:SAM-dependent methyltransferase